MHVDLIDILRCPNDHAESPLVAGATRQLERRILEGTLGCPVCGAEYRIVGRVADFGNATGPERGGRGDKGAKSAERGATDEAAIRLAAQLDLIEPGRRILLCGSYAALAPPLSVMFDALCLTCGVAPPLEQHIAAHASVLRIDTVLPLAPSSLHGIAIDRPHMERLGLEQVQRLARPRGRLVASTSTQAPAGMDVLARDDLEWVAERAAPVVPLKRAAR